MSFVVSGIAASLGQEILEPGMPANGFQIGKRMRGSRREEGRHIIALQPIGGRLHGFGKEKFAGLDVVQSLALDG
jgi:hypothetical protein